MSNVLLYGAYGYTGKLILEQLLEERIARPILVGRDAKKTELLAGLHNVDFDVANVEDFDALLQKHSSVELVINAAGPYVYTAKHVAEASIKHHMHYIDVTGEIDVFQQLHSLDDQAKQAGVMVLPGMGFDVMPTDCMASALRIKLPSATHLEMAFAQVGSGISRGTLMTSLLAVDTTTLIRENGKLRSVSWASQQVELNFGPFKRNCVAIPWGDLFTASISANFENIKVRIPMKPEAVRRLSWQTRLLQIGWLRRIALWRVRNTVTGPSAEQRDTSVTHLIGKAYNESGDVLEMKMETPDGYTLTARSAAFATQAILNGNLKPGFQTPAMAFGYVSVKEIEGVTWTID